MTTAQLPARSAPLRLPEWARKGSPLALGARPLRVLLREKRLHTVCEEARCPNLGECFSRGTATFMLLGDRCTRRCDYCSVSTAKPLPPDPDEPARVAEAARRLGLRYVVLTAVARDDLGDGGAAHFAATVSAVRRGCRGEAGGPDPGLQGRPSRSPDRSRFPARRVQPQHRNGSSPLPSRASPGRLRAQPAAARRRQAPRARARSPRAASWSGSARRMRRSRRSCATSASAGVDIVTVGQYLRPTREHAPVDRYVTPEGFRGRGRGPRAWVSRPSTPASSSALRSTPKRSSTEDPGAETEPPAGGPGRAVRGPPGPLVPQVRARGGGLGGSGAAARRASGAPTGRPAARLPLGRHLRVRDRLLDGARRDPVRRSQPSRGHRGHGAALPGPRAVPVALRLDGRPLGAGSRAACSAARAPGLGRDGDPARPHALQLPVVPARLQPAREPAVRPGRALRRGLRGVVPGRLVGAVLAYVAVETQAPLRRGALVAAPALLASCGWSAPGCWPAPCRSPGGCGWASCRRGILQEEKWDPEHAWQNIDRHLDLTDEAADQGARLVVWPESAVPFYFDDNPVLAEALRSTVQAARHLPALRQRRPRDPGARERLGGGQDAHPRGRARAALPQDPARSLRRVRAPAAAAHPGGAGRGQGGRAGGGLHPGPRGRDRGGGRPPGGRLHLLRGDLPRPGAPVHRAGGRAARQHHERRLVRPHLRSLPAPGHGRLPRGGERPLPGARRQHRHHRGGGPARAASWRRPPLFERTVLVRDVAFVARPDLLRRHGDVFAWAASPRPGLTVAALRALRGTR